MRETQMWCNAQCTRGACVFDVCRQHFLSPSACFCTSPPSSHSPLGGIYCGVGADAQIMKELGPPFTKMKRGEPCAAPGSYV